MTTRGALIGGFLGLISALVGVIFSPAVWEATLGYPKGSALFQISNPALFSMSIAFARHLAVLEARRQRRAPARPRRLRRPICALADGHRRLRRFGSLSMTSGAAEGRARFLFDDI